MTRAIDRLVRALPAPFRGWRRADDRGQTLVEYALLLVFIAIVVIAILILIGPQVSGVFQSVSDSLP